MCQVNYVYPSKFTLQISSRSLHQQFEPTFLLELETYVPSTCIYFYKHNAFYNLIFSIMSFAYHRSLRFQHEYITHTSYAGRLRKSEKCVFRTGKRNRPNENRSLSAYCALHSLIDIILRILTSDFFSKAFTIMGGNKILLGQ